ncbi:MAG: putative porin [Lutibacter sp.]
MNQLLKRVLFTISLIFVSIITAQNKPKIKKLNFYGDFRFRTELDRNSYKTDGTKRTDRDRLRYRLRFGFKYQPTDFLAFGGHIRSGNPRNLQSPHETLGKEFHINDFAIDRVYLKMSNKNNFWSWIGKNSMPFWQQNEMLWDKDINPEGFAFGSNFKIGGNLNITPVFGYFFANNSSRKFNENGRITIVQLKIIQTLKNNIKLTMSSGALFANSIHDRPDNSSTFKLNYNIWASSMQFNFKNAGFKLGLDYFKNLSNYNSNLNIEKLYKNQNSAFVGSLIYKIKKTQIGYYYAHIEKYAVIDYFAQDDWVRWGNSNMTRSSNFRGHEFSFIYNFNKKFNTALSTYFVKGIKTTGTTLETGTRVRLDFNFRF